MHAFMVTWLTTVRSQGSIFSSTNQDNKWFWTYTRLAKSYKFIWWHSKLTGQISMSYILYCGTRLLFSHSKFSKVKFCSTVNKPWCLYKKLSWSPKPDAFSTLPWRDSDIECMFVMQKGSSCDTKTTPDSTVEKPGILIDMIWCSRWTNHTFHASIFEYSRIYNRSSTLNKPVWCD